MWFKLDTTFTNSLGKLSELTNSWSVTRNLTNFSTTSTTTRVTKGQTYSATFTMNDGCTDPSYQVLVDNVDKTSTCATWDGTRTLTVTYQTTETSGNIKIIATATGTSSGGNEEDTSITLDSIAYGGKTYREIFINKNIMPNINNNVLLNNASNSITYKHYSTDYKAVIEQSSVAETNYVPSYYLNVSGTQSRYLQRESGEANATAGEIFFGGINVKITDWTAGRVGIGLGSDYSLSVAERVTNGYERLTAKITATEGAGYFLGSTGKASLTGYINNPVLVRGSIFGSNMPSESEWTELYNNYCSLLTDNT